VLHPFWQIAGVFFTAGILSALLYFYQIRANAGGENPWIYTILLFFAVSLFYSFDHIFDELKFNRNNATKRQSLLWNSGVFVFCGLALGGYTWWEQRNINFENLWLPLLLTFLYFLVVLILKLKIRAFKELLIAAVVSMAIFYPQAVIHGWASLKIQILHLFLVCVLNLMVFGFFEKEKDEEFGFSTIFSGLPDRLVKTILLVVFGAIFLFQAYYFLIVNSEIKPVFYCTGFYSAMLLFPKAFRFKRNYRFIADAALLLLLL